MKFLLSTLALAVVTFAPTANAQTSTVYDSGEAGPHSISVESNVPGTPFAVEGPAHTVIVRGSTPARVTRLSTSPVMVHYGDIPGCITPKPQQREIGVGNVRFVGKYTCPGTTNPVTAAGIKITPHQAEVLPGGMVKFTVAVHNAGTTTLNDAVATVQYDTDKLDLTVLPQGGLKSSRGVARWDVPELKAGETWTVVFQGAVAGDLADASRINVVSRVSGGSIAATAATVASTSVGVPFMPPTGAASAVFALLALLAVAAGTTSFTRRLQ